jgi:hypothetical protein
MNLRCALLLLPVVALSCCSSPPATAANAAAAPTAMHPVDCLECFTIIEYVRSGPPRAPRGRVEVRCDMCCNLLTFVTDDEGQLWVSSTQEPEPRPCNLCAPGR